MGVGYSASALHQIAYLEPDPDARERLDPPEFLEYLPPNIVWDGRPSRFRSPGRGTIVAWRDRISRKYRGQLGQAIDWNEDDEFEQSEDVRTDADLMLRYAAAVLDGRGDGEAAPMLLAVPQPSHQQMAPVFEEVERRGFTSRFPQLLMGSRYWLPFERNMIIEEPDWQGEVQRFGSTTRLSAELASVRAFIAAAAPQATAWTAQSIADPPDVLAAAWQASDTISRLCAAALAHRLPLWTTG